MFNEESCVAKRNLNSDSKLTHLREFLFALSIIIREQQTKKRDLEVHAFLR